MLYIALEMVPKINSCQNVESLEVPKFHSIENSIFTVPCRECFYLPHHAEQAFTDEITVHHVRNLGS